MHRDWFTAKRLGRQLEEKDGWKGFASELLLVVPLLCSFLKTVIAPTGRLRDHIQCFELLNKLLSLLSLGSDSALQFVDEISRTLRAHAQLFKRLYPDCIKPKFHHVFHVVDHMKNARKLLSCWVTERAHRTTKSFASHTFGNYERSLTREMLNYMVSNARSDEPFCAEHLVSPQPLASQDWQRSSSAALRCGRISRGPTKKKQKTKKTSANKANGRVVSAV